MKRVTISSKNQITLPSELLRQRGLAAGQKLFIVADDNGDILLTAKTPLRRWLDNAKLAQQSAKPAKKPTDPLAERQKLRKEWGDRM